MDSTRRQPDDRTPPPVVPGGRFLRVARASVADPLRFARLVASDEWLDRSTVLKRDKCSSVLAGRIDSLPVVVKSVRLNRPHHGWSAFLGWTRGGRQWRGAQRLASRGFATPELLVLSYGHRGGWLKALSGFFWVETLVMERLEGPTMLEVVAGRAPAVDDAAPRQSRLARAAGELVGAMSRAGLRNRDLKPSNVIVLASPESGATRGGYTLAQIDTVGVSLRTDADRSEMLFRLFVECVGTGNTPRRALRWRAALAAADNEPARARVLWRDVEARLRRHGDPTPRVNPLA